MPEEVLFNDTNLHLLTTLVVAFLAWLALQILTKVIVEKITVGSPRGRRLHTLSNAFKAFGSTIILVYVLFEVFKTLGVDLTPFIASASVIALAVGFGSQALVKDIVSGFFILAEDQFAEGDDVEIAGKRGIVERMSIRTVYLRDDEGVLHLIPNGSIAVVSNFSKQRKEMKDKGKKK